MSSEHVSKSGRRVELRLIEGDHYRRDAFAVGFRKLGFHVSYKSRHVPHGDDVLVLWNRYRSSEMRAREYEAAGATVLITENAPLGPDDKVGEDAHWFSLYKDHHNGAGSWRVGSIERWLQFGIELAPWRKDGKKILVLPGRGMGESGVAQPAGWLQRTIDELVSLTERPIVVRYHPGVRPHPPIDFSDTWAVVTWASGAALKALVAGIPVFYGLGNWVGAPAAVRGLNRLESPFIGDRLPMLRQLAWTMWRAEEIATGEPFLWLLCKSPYTSTESIEPESMSAQTWRRGLSVVETPHA